MAPARLRLGDHQAAEAVERLATVPSCADEEQRQVERAAPGLPVGGDVLGLVGDDQRQRQCRIAVQQFDDDADVAAVADRLHAHRDAAIGADRNGQRSPAAP